MNRALLLSFIMIFSTSLLMAQATFTLDPIPTYGTADLQDQSTYPGDVTAHATVTNNTNSVLKLMWSRDEAVLPEGWTTGVCDINTCYGVDVARENFELQPGQTGTMDVHAYPGGLPGSLEQGADPGDAIIYIKLTNVDDVTDTLSGTFSFSVTGHPLFPVSTVDQEIQAIKLYPNPTSSFFELSPADTRVDQVAVYNILGRKINQFQANESRFDVSDLPLGFYLVSLLDNNENILKTMRLQKR